MMPMPMPPDVLLEFEGMVSITEIKLAIADALEKNKNVRTADMRITAGVIIAEFADDLTQFPCAHPCHFHPEGSDRAYNASLADSDAIERDEDPCCERWGIARGRLIAGDHIFGVLAV